MREVNPIGYKITCADGINPPRVRFLIPPAEDGAREDQFYSIAAGDPYTVRLMRPDEIKESGLNRAPAVPKPEALASHPGHSEFTSAMLRSLGLTYRAINSGLDAPQYGMEHAR